MGYINKDIKLGEGNVSEYGEVVMENGGIYDHISLYTHMKFSKTKKNCFKEARCNCTFRQIPDYERNGLTTSKYTMSSFAFGM